MAGVSFFGEVIQQSSRAFWNDEDSDDENDASAEAKLHLTQNAEQDSSYHTLIIADGQIANEFVQFFLVDSKQCEVAKIHSSDDSPKRTYAALLKLKESVLLCVCSNVPVEYANQITEMLSPWIKGASQIIILGSAVNTYYRCDNFDLLPPSFLRSLKTCTWKESVKAPPLEIPNTVIGVPASVLSFCEILDISAVLYVCYADSLHIDSQSIQPLFNLFHTSPELSSLLKTDKNLKNYHYSSSITQSNMYL
nr:PREDICTED: proteasome assembly chaperone 1-like [Bemisia tabaci]XP_018913807.1 PREDICTED: proteasome assembly chaperone 1-like [Bemisia tabaci]XP_018913808.1 PREDICTED: proteasome assembly chaperone 1-like [Bemisia tabaci]XP_018913810.1 PREDICTED: proteasome assembly chaperone 1-like [Bemisia tabaci]XP_018913811.1 PREDICTED: proteasome assembly chaperone 1-like [Bemisia tabaci]